MTNKTMIYKAVQYAIRSGMAKPFYIAPFVGNDGYPGWDKLPDGSV